MDVSPGGKYFGLYSDFMDIYRGEEVSYATAVASAAGDGARAVADLAVPEDYDNPTILGGHPKILSFSGVILLWMTYDNGWWGDSPGGGIPFAPSYFLVELQGPLAHNFVFGQGADFSIYHYVSSDGGQSIYVQTAVVDPDDAITHIKVWRVGAFPGDAPPPKFWTNFIGSREIV